MSTFKLTFGFTDKWSLHMNVKSFQVKACNKAVATRLLEKKMENFLFDNDTLMFENIEKVL